MDELADRYPPRNAGELCLELANTLEPRTPDGGPRDHLGDDYAALLHWARFAGLLSTGATGRLLAAARRSPMPARRAVAAARELRAAVTATFAAVAAGEPPPPGALLVLRDQYAAAVGAATLVAAPVPGEPLIWVWPEDDLRRPVHRLAVSALELLQSERLPRVRQCPGDGCSVLFVDATRNGSRRWCRMRYCGNVAKSTRQAARRRAERAERGVRRGPRR